MKTLPLKQVIQVARRELRMDEPTYRLLLLNTAGSESTKEMSITQLKHVLDAFKRLGFVVKPSQKTKHSSIEKQISKIRALWHEMHEQGIIRDNSDIALNKFIYRETSISRLEWLGSVSASTVIEKLKQWQKRPVKA